MHTISFVGLYFSFVFFLLFSLCVCVFRHRRPNRTKHRLRWLSMKATNDIKRWATNKSNDFFNIFFHFSVRLGIRCSSNVMYRQWNESGISQIFRKLKHLLSSLSTEKNVLYSNTIYCLFLFYLSTRYFTSPGFIRYHTNPRISLHFVCCFLLIKIGSLLFRNNVFSSTIEIRVDWKGCSFCVFS